MIKALLFLISTTIGCAQEPAPVFNVKVDTPAPRCAIVPVIHHVCGYGPMCGYMICNITYQDGTQVTICTPNPTMPKRDCSLGSVEQ